jgi:hypothetical protein
MELYCARLRCTFEGISFVIPLEIYRKAWKKEFWRNLRGSKDPTLFVIIYEDEQLFWDYLLLSVEFS